MNRPIRDDAVHILGESTVMMINWTQPNITNDANDGPGAKRFEYTFAGVQMAICLYGFLGNSVLLCKQRHSLLWYNVLPLYLGIFAANALASFSFIIVAALRILTWSSVGVGQAIKILEGGAVLAGDIATTATIFSIAVLTFANFYDIRRIHSWTYDYHNVQMRVSIILLWTVWICAGLFGLLGLGVHDERGIVQLPFWLSASGHFGFVAILQLLVALTLFRIRHYMNKLQTDFVVHRAQQSLEFRTLLHRVSERTKIIVPLLTANVILWVILLTMDLIMDHTLGRTNYGQDQDPIWEELINFSSILYCALYPILISRQGGTLLKQLRRVFCFKYDVKDDISTSPVKSFTTTEEINRAEPSNRHAAQMAARHWLAMIQQWERVEPYLPQKPAQNTSAC